jgi:hypothetical protein
MPARRRIILKGMILKKGGAAEDITGGGDVK